MRQIGKILFTVLYGIGCSAAASQQIELPASSVLGNALPIPSAANSISIPQLQTLLAPYQTNPPNPNVLYATNFAGATAGDKISACISALPSTGGICDARGFVSPVINAITLGKNGAAILGPCGIVTVNGTIQVFDATNGIAGLKWVGCNGDINFTATQFLWRGNSSDPLFRIRGVRDSEFANFTVVSNPSFPLNVGIQNETATSPGGSTKRVFRQIYMNGTSMGGLNTGFRWCTGSACGSGGSGTDTNNDGDYIENVVVVNYTLTAFSIEHGQSKTHVFMNSSFNGGGIGQVGVSTTVGNGGSFRWYGGLGGANTVADFSLGAPTDNIVIEGCNLESSARLLQTSSTNIQWPVSIIGCRWTANSINADMHAILFQSQGPLTAIGNIIEGGNVAGQNPNFFINPLGNASGFASGNYFRWDTAAATSDPLTSSAGNFWTASANQISNISGSNQFQIPAKILLNPLTVATLPTCNAGYAGNRQYVTDQNTAASYRGAVTGSGTTKQAVWCDGTNWLQD